MSLKPFIVLCLFSVSTSSYYYEGVQYYTIGAVFDIDSYDVIRTFKVAVDRYNMYISGGYRFKINIKIAPKNEILKIKDAVCQIVQENKGVIGIFGPESLGGVSITQSICSALEIPHIQVNWKPTKGPSSAMSLNFYPDTDKLAKGFATILKHLNWRSYVILYEEDVALIRLQEILKIPSVGDNPVVIKKLDPSGDQRLILKQLADSKMNQIILDCEAEHILTILQQAQQVQLLDYFHSYFLTSLDAHLTNFSSLNTQANITYARLFDPDNPVLMNAIKDWEYEDSHKYERFTISPDYVRVETALMHDAVNLFLKCVTEVGTSQTITSRPLNCSTNQTWERGLALASYMQKRPLEKSVTGPISFNEEGSRTNFDLHIIEVNNNKNSKIATWKPTDPDSISYTRSSAQQEEDVVESLQKVKVIVSSRLGEPYLKLRSTNSSEILEGNHRYEGYSMDLIREISKELKFSFEFRLTDGNNYGNYDPKTKSWNGLIRDLLDRKAHLAICDLTITQQRRQVVDFSSPFMTLGIGILYKKTEKADRNIFAFMEPLSLEVWIYTATLYLAISLLIFFISRMAPGDWEKPHPCDENPEEKENIWNLKNCLWLTLGSIMTQGCDILPKGISSRLATSMWWFFSLLMTSSYTANLAAFLTMERLGPTIASVEALAKSKIKYGVVSGGSTEAFFRDSNYSLYQRMWTQMQQFKPSIFEKSNADGVKRVLTTKQNLYAFLMESVSIEYEMERNCDLKQIGNPLDNKGYGIAMPINAPYRSAINKAILKLQEDGTLIRLKTRWWKEKYGGGACDDAYSESRGPEGQRLGLANVGGVFLVLGIGVAIAFIIAIAEFLWNVRNVSVAEHITYWEALVIEVKFLVNIKQTKKKTELETKSTSSNQSTRAPSLVNGVVHGTRSLLNLDVLEKFNTGGKQDKI